MLTVMPPMPVPPVHAVVPVVCKQTLSPEASAVVVRVRVWLVAAVPLALNDPLCRAVPAEQAVPDGALLTETVAAAPVAVSTRPTMLVTVEAALAVNTVALLGLTVAIQPIGSSRDWLREKLLIPLEACVMLMLALPVALAAATVCQFEPSLVGHAQAPGTNAKVEEPPAPTNTLVVVVMVALLDPTLIKHTLQPEVNPALPAVAKV